MSKARGLGAVLAMASIAAVSGPVLAAPITLNFEGVVTQTFFDPFDPLGGAVQAGAQLYTYLNFDSIATDLVPASDVGSYTWSGGTYGLAAVVGSVVFPVMRSLNISIVDGALGGTDQYLVFASEGIAGGLGDYFSMSMLLEDSTGSAFSSDALPIAMPDLNAFAVRSFTLSGQYTDLSGAFIQYEVQGNLPIPEPHTAALVSLGLLGCAGFGMRKKRSV